MSKLIVGCGYLGRRAGRLWLKAGHEVFGVVRHASQQSQLIQDGIRPIVADVTLPDSLAGLPAAETVLVCVGYDETAGRSRWEVYVEGLRSVLNALTPATHRVIFISSTGVFGDVGGDWVDEDSPCRPERDSARALLAAERVLAEHPLGPCGIVLRLAGLYGPGRLPRTAELLSGRPLVVPPKGYVNLIHVDDAAAAVLAAEARARPPATFVIADGQPVERREYLRHLAQLLRVEPPVFCDSGGIAMERRSQGDKRVRNTRMLNELGVQLLYPNYKEGLGIGD